MHNIAGIIHPSAFQIADLFRQELLPSQYFRHKNLELAGWSTPLATNPQKDIWILFEGRLDNAEELRIELRDQLGFQFQTLTQEEVVVHAYDAWKEKALQRFKGPFATAIFDEKRETLFLGLDRLGQKPLYWFSSGNYWLFSTQIKTLLSTGIVPQNPDIEAFSAYLYFGFVPQDLAILSNVNKLLPGHYLQIDLQKRTLIKQYWSLSKQMEIQRAPSEEEFFHKLGKLMDTSIRRALPQKTPIGSFLQGNLGAAAMTWFLSHHAERSHLKAYTAAFEEPYSIDLQSAIAVTQTLSIQHQVETITPEEILKHLPAIVWHLDEPLADLYVAQTWKLASSASQEAQRVYTATGWEEVFGGAKRYFAPHEEQMRPSAAFILARLPRFLRDSIVSPLIQLFSKKYTFKILRNIDLNREQLTYLSESALFNEKTRKKVSPLLYRAFDPEIFTQRFHGFTSYPGTINPSLYYDAKTRIPDSKLYQLDRLVSTYDMQLVAPYLDHELVEFLARVPEEIKFKDHKPAALLKKLMLELCHHCPDFQESEGVFMKSWCNHPEFRALFWRLREGRLVNEGFISGKWIKRQLSYPYLIPETFKQLWALLVFEVWFTLFIANPITGAPPSCSTQELLK